MRQCSVACDPDEATLPFVVDWLDGNNIVFNTDYPHPDAPFPGSVDKFLVQPLRTAIAGRFCGTTPRCSMETGSATAQPLMAFKTQCVKVKG